MLSGCNGEDITRRKIFCYGCNDEVDVSDDRLRILGGGGLGVRDCEKCRSTSIRRIGK